MFVLFYCITIYNISCTVSLIVGLMAKSCYDEIQRGIHWKRGTGRKICFAFATMCGILCASGLLVLSAFLSQQTHVKTSSSNSTFLLTPAPANLETQGNLDSSDDVNMLGTLLHGNSLEDAFRCQGSNQSMFGEPGAPNQTVNEMKSVVLPLVTVIEVSPDDDVLSMEPEAEADVSTEVRQALSTAYVASMQNPNLWQMLFVLAACSYIPFFLGQTPDSIRLPVLMETVQPEYCNSEHYHYSIFWHVANHVLP